MFAVINDRAGSDINTPRPGHDEFSVGSRENEAIGSSCCGLDGGALTTFNWAITSGADPLSSAELPTAPLALERWGPNVFGIRGDKGVFGPPYFTINGTVTRVVPEAASGGLLAVGVASALLLGLVARRRLLRAERSRRAALLAGVACAWVSAEVHGRGLDRVVSNPLAPNEEDGITQSETAVVAMGSIRCAAWNDMGQDEVTGQPVLGWGVSANGGAAFTDQGQVPLGPAWPTDPPAATSVPGFDPALVRRTADNPADTRLLLFALDGRLGFPWLLGMRGILWYDSVDCSSLSFGGRVTHVELFGGVDKPMAIVDNTRFLPNGQPNPRYRRAYVVFNQAHPDINTIWMA